MISSKKGTGEKTIMTEALPKKKNKLVFYVLSSLILQQLFLLRITLEIDGYPGLINKTLLYNKIVPQFQ